MSLALEFSQNANRTASARELAELLAATTVKLDFDYYALVRCSSAQGAGPDDVHLFNFPRHWTGQVDKNAYFTIDPVRVASTVHRKSFLWADVGNLISLSERQKAMLHASQDAGLAAGYAVPIIVEGEIPGVCSFGRRSSRDFPYGALLEAQLVGQFAFNAAARLRARNDNSDLPRADKSTIGGNFIRGLMGLSPRSAK